MKKKLIIIIITIIIVIMSVIGYFIFNDANEEKKLQDEITFILNNIDISDENKMNEIDKKLTVVVSKGDYARVETAFKKYLYDYIHETNLIDISKKITDRSIFSTLSIKNYISDGPLFVQTKEFLNTNIKLFNDSKQKLNEFSEESKTLSYLNTENLNEYYINLYNNYMDSLKSDNNNISITETLNKIIEILENSNEIIELLSDNPYSWSIENNQVVFSSEMVMNEYNNLFSKFNKEKD